MLRWTIIAAGVGAYFAIRLSITVTFGLSNYRHLENPIAYQTGEGVWINIVLLAGQYGWLSLWPSVMCADYSFNAIPLATEWSDPRVTYVLAIFAILAGACLFSLYKIVAHRSRPALGVLALLGWILVTYLPASNVFFYVGTMVGERLLYLPTLGLVLLGAWGVYSLLGCDGADRMHGSRALFFALLGLAIALGSARTISRVEDWTSEEALFGQAAAEPLCAGSAKTQMHRGILFRRERKWRPALARFKAALKIEPEYCANHHWLGLTYLDMGKLRKAVTHLQQGLSCVYTMAQSGPPLIAIYGSLIQQYPGNYVYYVDLAKIFVTLDKPGPALRALDTSLALNPTVKATHELKISILDALGRQEQATTARQARDTVLEFVRIATQPETRKAFLASLSARASPSSSYSPSETRAYLDRIAALATLDSQDVSSILPPQEIAQIVHAQ